MLVSMNMGRATAEAVGHRLPNLMAQVRAQVRSCGICGRQRCIEAGSF
jgi:hypothetical protein